MATKTKQLDTALRTGDIFKDGLGREVTVLRHLFLNNGRNVRLTLSRAGKAKTWDVDL